MKTVVISIFCMSVVFVSNSQKTFRFAAKNLMFFQTNVKNYTPESIPITDTVLDDFFLIYDIDLVNNIVINSVTDEPGYETSYHILTVTNTKNKINLVLYKDFEISVLSMDIKGKHVKTINHYSIKEDLVNGFYSKTLIE